jgi:hypothetical protein
MGAKNPRKPDGGQIAQRPLAMNLLTNHAGSIDVFLPQHPAVALDSTTALPERAPATSQEEFVEAQRVFDVLDGSALSISGHQWLVEVFSVSDQAPHRWVQVGVTGDQNYMVTLRLNAGAGAQRALDALSTWLDGPSDAPLNGVLRIA